MHFRLNASCGRKRTLARVRDGCARLIDVSVHLGHPGFDRPLPLLKSKRFACPGENSKKVRVPGKTAGSDLSVALTLRNLDLETPPKENIRLAPEEIKPVKAWIDAVRRGRTSWRGRSIARPSGPWSPRPAASS